MPNRGHSQTVVVKKKTSRPADMTMCVPYRSDSLATIAQWIQTGNKNLACLECDGLRNNSWNVWDDQNFIQGKTNIIN